MTTILEKERDKYAACFQLDEYLKHSPGQHWAKKFGKIANPELGDLVADFGCGSGRGGQELEKLYGVHVTYIDMANYFDLKPFIAQPLWRKIPKRYRFGFCCDVMEHIPQEYTMLAVQNMLDCCGTVFFSISFLPDHFGQFLGETLHLTVKPFVWWRDRLGEIGNVIDARDTLGEGIFYVGR